MIKTHPERDKTARKAALREDKTAAEGEADEVEKAAEDPKGEGAAYRRKEGEEGEENKKKRRGEC